MLATSPMHNLMEYNDLIALLLSATLLGLYNIYLRFRMRQDPHYTVQAVNRHARTEWVKSMMDDPQRNIVGVQTLRNATMAATFMASTAVLLIIGTLNLSGDAAKLTNTWHALNFFGSSHPGLWLVKLLFLVTDFFVAFFAFSLSVRLYNHVGFHISVPPSGRTADLTPRSVAIHINRAGAYYSIGMRAYYFSVPLVFWLFGPVYMLAATVVLIAVMYHIDRSPRESGPSAQQENTEQ
jgi:uncharacterized membrane protein